MSATFWRHVFPTLPVVIIWETFGMSTWIHGWVTCRPRNLPSIFYLDIYMVIFFRSTTAMFPSLPPPERVVPIVRIIHKKHGRTCDVHRLGGGTVLLSMRTMHGFGGLLHWPRIGTGRTHHLFCSRLRERSFKVTNQFYFKYEKINN